MKQLLKIKHYKMQKFCKVCGRQLFDYFMISRKAKKCVKFSHLIGLAKVYPDADFARSKNCCAKHVYFNCVIPGIKKGGEKN